MSTRLKRLYNDYKEVSQIFANHPYIVIKSVIGDPPEKYQVEYRIKGIEQKGSEIIEKDKHLVEIILTLDYPRKEPICRMLTPIFHPNIDHLVLCAYDPGQWAASISLADVIIRIGKIISYQIYNIKSPRNGEAAKWAAEHFKRFPIDTIDLTVKRQLEETVVTEKEVEELKTELEQKQEEKEEVETFCSNCGTRGEKIHLQECSNGHFVCSHCIVECQKCERILCVLCPLNKCSICEKILCNECQTNCSVCNQSMCKEHVVKCNICQNEGCIACFLTCSECHKAFCKTHFNEQQNRCEKCVQTSNKRIRITYEELSSYKIEEKLLQETIKHCKNCGYKIEGNPNFCIMCGNKLRELGFF